MFDFRGEPSKASSIQLRTADACNAMLRCDYIGCRLRKQGWCEMGGKVVKISARLVQDLLVGNVNCEMVAECHN